MEGDLRSPRTIPLLSFLLRSDPARHEESNENILSQVKQEVGGITDPIDESYQEYQQFMSLIQKGLEPKVSGKSVRVVIHKFCSRTILH